MPLVRYELRSEHSLANPELFRSAARDDPEGLLEGVAMAGLVGIVRQLGDLAEYVSSRPFHPLKLTDFINGTSCKENLVKVSCWCSYIH